MSLCFFEPHPYPTNSGAKLLFAQCKHANKILPLSEVATKDDFFNIKNANRDDLLSAHRVPPQMMGIIPNNTGGFGDVKKAAQIFVRNELTPLQERMKEVNEWIGEEVIKFAPYELPGE